MLGLEQTHASPENFFYNEFISQVLFNRDIFAGESDPQIAVKQCMQKLDKVAVGILLVDSEDKGLISQQICDKPVN